MEAFDIWFLIDGWGKISTHNLLLCCVYSFFLCC